MTLDTAYDHEAAARAALNHAMDRFAAAPSEAARRRHIRRVRVAHEKIERARYAIRQLIGAPAQ